MCSGVANQFDFDPLYLRGAFAILFFAFGTGLLLYILLWIIIPKAETTAEKLEMRGEPINVDNIKRSVEEEMSDLKNRVNNLRSQTNVRTGIDKIIDFVSTVVKGFFRIIMRVLSVFFITIGFILLFVLISSVFGFTNFVHTSYEGKDIAYSLHDLMMALFSNGFQLDLTKLGLLLFIGVPLIMLIYNGIKILFKMHTQNRIVKITSLVLWLSGLIILLYVGSQIGSEFKEETEFKETAKISAPVKNGVLYLNALKDNKYNFEEKFGYQSRVKIDGWNLVKINEKGISFGFPMLRVEKSDTDSFELAITKVASGFDKKEAVMRARSINYEFAQHDSVIDFSSCFDLASFEISKQELNGEIRMCN